MVMPLNQIEKCIAYIWTKIIEYVEEQQYSDKEEQASIDLWDKFWDYFDRWALNILTTAFISFDLCLMESTTDGAVLGSTGKTTYASGAYQSPL